MKPTIPEVIDQFYAYYCKPGNLAWGTLHLVLDDHNVEDDHVEFCIRFAQEEGDEDGEKLARILLRMSKTQRLKLPGVVSQRYDQERGAKLNFGVGMRVAAVDEKAGTITLESDLGAPPNESPVGSVKDSGMAFWLSRTGPVVSQLATNELRRAMQAHSDAIERDLAALVGGGIPLEELELRSFPSDPFRQEVWHNGRMIRRYTVKFTVENDL